MTEQHLSFQFTARYYKSSEITSETKAIWFVLHGYGQLAQYFIRKFASLEQRDICVIAPEGLSKFYLDQLENTGRKSTRVGATWMTKENRLVDIDNYLTFLNSVYSREVTREIPVSILGFSQGSATASRWALSGKIRFDRLILWAGIFPPDMNFEVGPVILKDKKVMLIYGTKDRFLNDARFHEMDDLTKKLNAKVEVIAFDGEHDIDEPTLQKII